MSVVKVTYSDWNGEEHSIDVTSDMCAGVNTSSDEKMIICAIRYCKRTMRPEKFYKTISVEIIAD